MFASPSLLTAPLHTHTTTAHRYHRADSPPPADAPASPDKVSLPPIGLMLTSSSSAPVYPDPADPAAAYHDAQQTTTTIRLEESRGTMYPPPRYPKTTSSSWEENPFPSSSSSTPAISIPPTPLFPGTLDRRNSISSNLSLSPALSPSLASATQSSAADPAPANPRKRGKLPKHVTETLRAWLMRHADHPYPTEEEKKMLVNVTGLSMSQVSNWMINVRLPSLFLFLY